jgi:hypothetical protein
VGLLALFLSQSNQGFVGNRLHKTVSQNTQRHPRGADVLASGHVLLDFCVRESGIWTNGAIIHQGATGDDLGSMRDRNVRVMKKVVWPYVAYAQLGHLAGPA